MIRHYALIVVLLLTGCAGLGQVERISDLSGEQLKQMRDIQLYDSDKGLNFRSHGRIKGLSCKGSGWSGYSREDSAMTQLKIKAVKVRANGILYPTCSHDASVDWGNNCWESWVCVGEAITVE
ncbi:RcsF lipoprotein [Nitrosovibrio tenuis]|uniref:RcsF lipoprotein n=2 Tax=Nitrosovibrio tenuis TaxID=1233 RepID=A0A1H7RZR2_9PROT|nr:RcsF lipoprotein [Nitrosovibrio tenuis]